MKKRKNKGNLIKIIVALTCIFTLCFSMPQKSDAGLKDWIKDSAGGAITSKVAEKLKGIAGDFVNLILLIPDGILQISDTYVGGIKEPVRYEVEKKEYMYNFGITPYEIFKSGVYEYDETQDVYKTNMGLLDINFFSNKFIKSQRKSQQYGGVVISKELAPAISKVYNNIRNLCIIVMVLVLMYIGIKIMISSIAEQQAKYKQLLIDWLVAFSLLFIMHYIMSFVVNINYLILEMLCNDEGDSYYVCDEDNGSVSEVKSSWDANDKICRRADGGDYNFGTQYLGAINLNESNNINNSGDAIDVAKWGKDGVVPVNMVIIEDENDEIRRIFKMNTLSYVRTVSYATLRNDEEEDNEHKVYLIADGAVKSADSIDSMGYSILYVVLTVEIVMFIVIYVKRVIQLAFLTMIAPLVAFMYPLDKIGDGKAQAFNSWFKDYLFGVLIQPMHLLLYTVFIRAAGSLLSKNIVYALAVYAYMIPAEKYFKKILGFEKNASGVGMGGPLAGALGAGLAMGGLNKIAGIGPGSKGGGGGKGKTDPRKHKIPKRKFSSGGGAPGSSGLGSGLGSGAPGASGRGRYNRSTRGGVPAAGGGVPGVGGSRRGKFVNGLKKIGGYRPPILNAAGRTISRAATGGRYESLYGTPGALRAAFTNLAGKGFKGSAKLAGMALGGATGLIAGTASAIVNGREGDILSGVLVGASAGNKHFGNLAGMATDGLGTFADTVSHDFASSQPWYADRLRTREALEQFSPELADLSTSDRKKYAAVIERMSPYVDFGSFDEVKSMAKAMEMASGEKDITKFNVSEHGAAADAIFKAAKNWGDLKSQDGQNSYLKFIDAEVRAGVQNGSINVPNTPEINDAWRKAKDERDEAIQKQKEELEAEYDKKLRNARDTARRTAIDAEYNRKLANVQGQTDAQLLEEIKVDYAKQQKLREVLASQEDLKKS